MNKADSTTKASVLAGMYVLSDGELDYATFKVDLLAEFGMTEAEDRETFYRFVVNSKHLEGLSAIVDFAYDVKAGTV